MIIAAVSSDAYEDIIYDALIDEGVSASAANKYSECIPSEFLELIEATPAEDFDVSESELDALGERLAIEATKTCVYS